MSVVAFRLAGPLQSWGVRSRFVRRETEMANGIHDIPKSYHQSLMDDDYNQFTKHSSLSW